MATKEKNEYYGELLRDPLTPTTILNIILADYYDGFDFLSFDYATIFLDLKDILKKIDKTIKEKIKALVNLNTTDAFFQDWVAFENICWILNDKIPMFDKPTPMQGHELIWGIIEAEINASDPDEIVYSAEVKKYIRESLKYGGFYKVPDEIKYLKIALPVQDFEATEEVKKIQQLRLLQVTAYVNERKKIIEDISKKIESYN